MRGRLWADLRHLVRLRALPRKVAWFHWRAYRHAARTGDVFSLASATRPGDLATVLELAQNRHRVVELGTGTGWTAIALALADPDREVTSYDPVDRPEREGYLALVAESVRDRITFVNEPGSRGPRDDDVVDLLYVDSSHERAATVEELGAWQPALKPGAVVLLDDYSHPEFPGVREAVRELGLRGVQRGSLFVSRAPV